MLLCISMITALCGISAFAEDAAVATEAYLLKAARLKAWAAAALKCAAVLLRLPAVQ